MRRLDRASHLERVGRWLARREQEVQVRIARELVSRCRSLTRQIDELSQELEQPASAVAPALLELPGCGAVTAAKLPAEIGPISRFNTDAQLARHSGVAPLQASSGKSQRHRLDRGVNRQLNAALYRIAITQSRYHPAARAYYIEGLRGVAVGMVLLFHAGIWAGVRGQPASVLSIGGAGFEQRGEAPRKSCDRPELRGPVGLC